MAFNGMPAAGLVNGTMRPWRPIRGATDAARRMIGIDNWCEVATDVSCRHGLMTDAVRFDDWRGPAIAVGVIGAG